MGRDPRPGHPSKERWDTVCSAVGRIYNVSCRRTERMPMDPFGGMLQIASPPPPHEKDWVMVAGNETQVYGILHFYRTDNCPGRPSARGFSWNGRKTGIDWSFQSGETGKDQRSIFTFAPYSFR